MTDLTSIWAEQLSHKDILERAEQGSTTIDPSEGDDQLDLLLTKIGEALDGSNGKPSINSGSRADSIKINISAKLPAPLRPLNWYLNLSKESASSLTKLIILPLLKDEAAWESRQQLLLDQLRQKDWVLSKVFDRIEALGIEMGSIFPSAAGLRSAKKANTRSELAKLIKGVAPFDEQAWLTQSKDCYDGSSAASNIAHELFGSKNERSTADSNPVRDNWWTELGNSTIAAQEGTGQPPKGSDARMPSPSPAKDSVTQEVKHSDPDLDDGDITAETTDSEFEKSSSSPGPKLPPRQRKSARSHANKGNESTASESEPDLDSAPAPQKSKPTSTAPKQDPTQKPPKKAPGRLGVIGGKKKQAKAPSPPKAPTPEPPTQVSESEIHHETSPIQSPSPAKVKKPSRLGVVGGKKKEKRQETPPSEPPAVSSSYRLPTKSPQQDHVKSEQNIKDLSPKKEKPTELPAVKPPQAPETEEEKVSRRREELKRQLEAQSKAPAKKKRRF
ncbi:hypothetical protein VI817_002855 [Penicillium citrinum]|nr:hypothetical protein VI817_002855 [Penicillium citrinum]